MASEQYLAKLRDPRWQKMRLQVLERDDWACQICSDTESTLHVHHRYYLGNREPWEYRLDALVTLCELCHKNESEGIRSAEDDLILILKQSGAMTSEFTMIAGIFAGCSQLNDYEWSVLWFVLDQLMEHRPFACGDWSRATEEFKIWCANRALRRDDA